MVLRTNFIQFGENQRTSTTPRTKLNSLVVKEAVILPKIFRGFGNEEVSLFNRLNLQHIDLNSTPFARWGVIREHIRSVCVYRNLAFVIVCDAECDCALSDVSD